MTDEDGFLYALKRLAAFLLNSTTGSIINNRFSAIKSAIIIPAINVCKTESNQNVLDSV
jgi:hypothetical protein